MADKNGAAPGGVAPSQRPLPAGMLPSQDPSVSEYEVGEELVLFDPRNDNAHILNGTAALVWWLCDGQRVPEQIAREVASHYKADGTAVASDVRAVLRSFMDARLITWR